MCTKPELVCPFSDPLGGRPAFTLKCEDYEIKPESHVHRAGGVNLLRSLYQVYLEYGDPSEYTFAQGTFGPDGWNHWLRLRDSSVLRKTYPKMKLALQAKIESEAFQAARRIAKGGLGPQSLQAAKWLHDSIKVKSGRGRPSKAQIDSELRVEVQKQTDLRSDMERLGL